MDLPLEEEDFDSELLIFDNEDEEDKHASVSVAEHDEGDNNTNTNNNNEGISDVTSSTQQQQQQQQQQHYQPTVSLSSISNHQPQHSFLSFQTMPVSVPVVDPLNAMNANMSLNNPFFNTFISTTLADNKSSLSSSSSSNLNTNPNSNSISNSQLHSQPQGSSQSQSQPIPSSNVLNAGTGLPLFLPTPTTPSTSAGTTNNPLNQQPSLSSSGNGGTGGGTFGEGNANATATATTNTSTAGAATVTAALIGTNQQQMTLSMQQQQQQQLQLQNQHLPNIDNYLLEPIFPPNFFLSGLPNWEPTQAVTSIVNNNPQASPFSRSPAVPSSESCKPGSSNSNNNSNNSNNNSNSNSGGDGNGNRNVNVNETRKTTKKATTSTSSNTTSNLTQMNLQLLGQEQNQERDGDTWDHIQVSKHIALMQANHAVKNMLNNTNNNGGNNNNSNDNAMQLHSGQPVVPVATAAPAPAEPLPQHRHYQQQHQAGIPLRTQSQAHPISDNDSASNCNSSGGRTTMAKGLRNTNCNNNNNNNKASKKTKTQSKNPTGVTGTAEQLPPFYLFDAPVELRHNFIQAQLAMNIPTLKDSNTYHYNIAVNTVQSDKLKSPNNNMLTLNPPMLNNLNDILSSDGKKVQLLDARQKKAKKGNERNEREQQRAQKITELIDKLRTTMVQGGWKVEMKSKYQTLSTCAEYVKHLIAVAKEKEDKLAKTKADLAIREQELKEDKVLQDSRSDPESVTSSLTAFSTSSANINLSSSPDMGKSESKGKEISASEPSSEETSKKLCTDDGSGLSSETGHKGKNISVDKMSSNVSDMTDSNKGSSDGKGNNQSKPKTISNEVSSQRSGEVEVSSTAAVVSGIRSQEHGHQHGDIVIKMGPRDRKRKHRSEKSSLDKDFNLDYEEVFLSSNIPQVIANLAGRIIAWLSKKDINRITIFSLVKATKLSTLYELIAEAIRKNNAKNHGTVTVPSSCSSKGGSTTSEEINVQQQNLYRTIILPCNKFPNEFPKSSNSNDLQNDLFMTVTFIWDVNPRKRCLHCALSDTLGNGGKDGYISATLLASLLAQDLH